MKRLLFIMLLMLTVFQSFSQTEGISYQAVILSPEAQEIPGVNVQGNILVNTKVAIQFTIINASSNEEYEEHHITSTDRYGMINLLIGSGITTSNNSFTDIIWDGTTKKMKVEIDFSGSGSNFSLLSEQNLTYMPHPVTEETTQLIVDNLALISAEKIRATAAEQINAAAIALNTAKVSYPGDQDISGIATNAGDISTLQGEQTTQNSAIALNTAKVSYPGDQDISGIATNAGDISTLQGEQTTQNSAIALNTAKVSYPGDQDISGIATNAGDISTLQGEQTTQNSAIALNTAKVSYPGDQDISGIATNAGDISTLQGEQTSQNSAIALNTAKVSYPGDQDISGIATNAGNISTLQGEQTSQNSAIALNTAKVSYPGDQDISGIATNAGDISTLQGEQTTQNSAIALNTAKVSYPGDQDISGIATNAGDISTLQGEQTTQNSAIALNTAKVSYPGDQDISGIATNAGNISTLQGEQTTQNSAIALNTAKVSYPGDQDISGIATNAGDISTLQGEQTTQNSAIALNTAKVSYPGDQDISGIATNAGNISTLQGEQTTQNSAIALNTAKVSYPGDQDLSSYATNANLALKANLASPTFTGTVTISTLVAGTNTYPTTAGSANQVLQTDGSGVLTWKTLSPVGTTTGQMQYWNGTAWVTVAHGTTGQVLTIGAGGVPSWEDNSNGGTIYYLDADADGYGDINQPIVAVTMPSGYVSNNTDCDDTVSAINPDAIEVCDGIDNNCDGSIDEGLTFITYYVDADGDGYGDSNDVTGTLFCANPGGGYSLTNDDCNDSTGAANPGATEVCDGIDNNCDGSIDEGLTFITYYVDVDRDGYGDSNDATGALFCANPGVGYSLTNDDCDDSTGAVNPGKTEVCDGVDNNCDGLIDEGLTFITYYVDVDRDGYGDSNDATGALYCSNPGVGYSLTNDDCDDSNSAINPGIIEDNSDGIDNNCDGQIDELSIGQYINGGIVFYIAPTPTDLNSDGVLDTGLVCAIEDQGAIQWWKGSHVDVFGARVTDISAGSSNTDAIISTQGGTPTTYAAGFAKAYNGGSFNDWFLPSKDALYEMFINQDIINTASVANGGAAFVQGFRWSSTQSVTHQAWEIWFGSGACGSCSGEQLKNTANSYNVRAIRAF